MYENDLAIVMYHYVRALKNSRYPEIRGLDLEKFRVQISFLKENFNIISCELLLDCIKLGKPLPEKAILLSFDDGYIDHFTNVLPILNENKLTAFFSVPGRIIEEGKLLDVNKLHFILASSNEKNLVAYIFGRLDHYRGGEFAIASNKELYNELALATRFDTADTIFIKRALQVKLPERLRNLIVDELFAKYVSLPERSFAKELYMSMDQIKMMKRCGMSFGIHGYEHYWLGQVSEEKMKADISKALDVFDGVVARNNWIMCYPFGSYTQETIDYVKKAGAAAGFSTQVNIANLDRDNHFTLPRLDTNDFPPVSEKYSEFRVPPANLGQLE